jgi:hypothetical protein
LGNSDVSHGSGGAALNNKYRTDVPSKPVRKSNILLEYALQTERGVPDVEIEVVVPGSIGILFLSFYIILRNKSPYYD